MSNKQTFILAAFSAAAISLASCSSDDYNPIYLVEAETQTALEGNQLQISIFNNEGEKYLIRGGKGNYTVSITDKSIADFRYDGDTLTYLPVSAGTTESIIADRSGNSYQLSVNVGNPQSIFTVTGIDATVIGGELTQNQTQALQNEITQNSPVKIGGRFELTYADKELSSGDIKIYPEATGGYSVGIFEQSRKYNENTGAGQVCIEATMAGTSAQTYTFFVTYLQQKTYRFQKDVTNQYKGTYPALEEAYRIYELKVEQ